MSTTTQAKRMTAEEFLLAPDPDDGSRLELVEGEVYVMAPPGGMHGVSCNKVGRHIGNFVAENLLGVVTSNDTGFITRRDPDSVRGPDIAYWSKQRLPVVPVGYIEVAPDLAVEVMSPSNTSKQIRAKVIEYFEKGVRMVWVIAPEDRTLTIYRTADEGRVFHENAVVSGDEILAGFSCRVSDLLP